MKFSKHLFLFLFFVTGFRAAQAQYANAWINYNQQYFKIRVAADGVYRIGHDALQAAGVPVASVNGNTFRLYGRGVSVPLYASSSTNPLGANDYLEFYGIKNDGATEAAVYNAPADQANDKLSMFTDTAAYFLTWSSTPNPDIITDYNNVITNPPPKENYVLYTSSIVYGGARLGANYIHGKPEIQGQSIWDSDFSHAEGYIDVTFNHTSVTRTLSTPFVFTDGPAARFRTQWNGKFPTTHFMEITVGNTLVATRSYDGFNVQRLDTLLPGNTLLSSPNTTLKYSSANNPNYAVADANGLSYIEITYPRQPNADNTSLFRFKMEAGTGQRYLAITNFNTQGTTPVLYDLTNKLRLTAVAGGNDTLKFLLPAANGERELVMVANMAPAVASVIDIKPVSFVDFSSAANQGNFIIVSHPFFHNDGNGNDYVNEYRQMKINQGHQAVVVDVHQLYDQFAWGIDLNPLSIRNFTDFVLGTWGPAQKFMMIVGKGIEFHAYNTDPTLRQHCYVPTWGYPGSDILLTAQPGNATPRIPIGRLSIMSHPELKNYKDKVDQFVALQQQPQTIENKRWMKNVVHLAGGENENDQFIFQYILNTYASQVEDSVYFGGDATLFSKNSSDPITTAASAEMDSLISNGVSLITFFGHSSFQSLDFNLNDPYNYHNDNGKYPLILTNGCLVGNLFSIDDGLGGSFMYAQNRGSIGFLAPSSFSVSNSLQLYTDAFYRHYTKEHYHQPIGIVIQKASEAAINFSGSGVDRAVAEQMLFTGDPSLYLNTFPKPDYAIEDPSVYINPTVVTAGVDTFTVNIVVTNIGKAIDDSIYIDITRIQPDGQQSLVVHQKVKAPYLVDTFSYKMSNNTLTDLGLNQFNIRIDAESEIDELSETNNELTHSIFIQSDDILPVFPYDFSIVNDQNVELKASTVNPFVVQGRYVFQIDTTELFNSPFLKSTIIVQDGGVVKWTPVMTMTDSTVYYWRTSIDTVGGKQYSWHGSSFTFLPLVGTGWSQSHYYQYLHDNLTNVELGSNRLFSFVDDVKNVSVYNGVSSDYGGPLNWDQLGYFINNVKMAKWTCGGGVNWLFAVIDPATGIQWQSVDPDADGVGQFGNMHCMTYDLNAFYFNSTNPSNFQKIIDFIDTIPTGHYVLAMSINNPAYAGFSPELEQAFQTIGASSLDTLTESKPYVLFSKKGDPNYPVYEVTGDTITSIIDTSFNITGSWSTGYLTTAQIGPAASWQSLHWKVSDAEPLDEIRLQVIGIKSDGSQNVLVQNVVSTDTSLAGIDANVYPYLRLRMDYTDTLNRTPPQTDYLRIHYQLQPELAIDPHLHYTITDTVNKFSFLNLAFAVANVSPVPMYNVPVKYTITDVANVPHVVTNTLDTILANDTVHAQLSYQINSSAFSGLNKIIVEINPFGPTHQPEQYHFNNFATTTFTGTQDNVNPYMDVTFDGQHIMDGDIVSAKPEISIRLKDDNSNLKLDDSAAFSIKLQWPDGSVHDIPFDNITAWFTPASGTSNTASAIIRPLLTMDGRYELIAQGYDKSGNAAGKYAYRVGFDIVNKPMISNVLNYPNPFTTQTRFVFTLTGSRIPEFFKIQIMTITGKVVREIYKPELGPIHIGHNITEFAWDGTDQYGDKLANGLYLYRVVTRLDDNSIERYETSVDRMFEKGFGKMYLMR